LIWIQKPHNLARRIFAGTELFGLADLKPYHRVFIMLLCLALLIASGCNFVSQATIPTFLATEFIQPHSASAVFEENLPRIRRILHI